MDAVKRKTGRQQARHKVSKEIQVPFHQRVPNVWWHRIGALWWAEVVDEKSARFRPVSTLMS